MRLSARNQLEGTVTKVRFIKASDVMIGVPRARRPAVSRGHARALPAGCTGSGRTLPSAAFPGPESPVDIWRKIRRLQ
jgi:hypothetical protein